MSASLAGAGAGSAASSSAPTATLAMFTVFKGKGESLLVERQDPDGASFGKHVMEIANEGALDFKCSSDGLLVAVVKKDKVQLYGFTAEGAASLAHELPEENVTNIEFSPLGKKLLTLRKKRAGNESPNLRVWSTETGAMMAEIFSKASAGSNEEWPPLQWTADEKFACRMTGEGLSLLDGETLAASEASSVKISAAQRFWVSPAAVPAGKRSAVVTFMPRTKSKPGAVSVWSLPPTPAPIASKSLQSDACRVEFNCDGTAVLAELSTASSATSYYGDSRLFLFSTDGKINLAVPQAKEGPVADFAWNPTDPTQFIVIAGRSPPAATLHTLPKGDAVFSFGAGAFNTVKYQPQGKMVALGGFGNMSGDVQVWDCKKFKAVSPVFNTPVATQFTWAPSGRHFLAATTRPRLMVDNGYRVWTYKGQLLHHAPWEQLFEACWRPQSIAAFPDRPPSPMLKGKAAAAAAAAEAAAAVGSGSGSGSGSAGSAPSLAPLPAPAPAAAASGGKYVPPHLRNAAANAAAVGLPSPASAAGAGSPTSVVSAMMSEGYQKAGRIGAGGGFGLQGPKPVPVIPGLDPTAAAGAKKKKKRSRKPKGAAGAAGGAAGAAGEDDGEDGEDGED